MQQKREKNTGSEEQPYYALRFVLVVRMISKRRVVAGLIVLQVEASNKVGTDADAPPLGNTSMEDDYALTVWMQRRPHTQTHSVQ